MRVLVTEDEPTMARLVSQGLVEDGHEVEIVATGERAVDAVRETVYDLVLLDVMLPALAAVKRRFAKRLRSSIGSSVRSSRITNPTARKAVSAKLVTVRALPHPYVGASMIV